MQYSETKYNGRQILSWNFWAKSAVLYQIIKFNFAFNPKVQKIKLNLCFWTIEKIGPFVLLGFILK